MTLQREDKVAHLVSSCGSNVAFRVIVTWKGFAVLSGAPSS